MSKAIAQRGGSMRRFVTVVTILVSCAFTPTLRAELTSGAWRWTRSEDGITSWQNEQPDRTLSAFRAQLLLDADVWTALAILEDVDRACEWTSHCAEMRRISAGAKGELLVYARIDAPWPVRDRDVVVGVYVSYGASGDLLISIEGAPDFGPPSTAGVVRMPRFRAHYRFVVIDPQHTQVEYQLDVDPGGTLPDWLKRIVARDLAHDTLADLRERARWALSRGEYQTRKRGLAASAQARGFRQRL